MAEPLPPEGGSPIVLAQDTFRIAYDGAAIESHEMDVRDLAPALLGLADLIDAINEEVNPKGTEVRVKLRATGEGSLVVQIALDVSWVETLQRLFTSTPVQSLINIKEVLGIGAIGIFYLLKKLRGAAPHLVAETVEGMLTTIEIPGEGTIEIPRSVYQVLRNDKAREAARRVVAPLKEPGIDEFKLYTGDDVQLADPVEVVTSDEIEGFTAEPVEVQELDTAASDRTVQIISPQFSRKYKWRFTDGVSVFHAEMGDDNFWAQVENRHAVFGSGDLMRVRIETAQRLIGGKLTAEHRITQVYEVIPNKGQQALDI